MSVVCVVVTADDIRKGRVKNVLCCPVALALRRATGRGWTIGLGFATPWKSMRAVALPDDVAEIISDFDEGEEMAPFGFDLYIPDDVLAVAR